MTDVSPTTTDPKHEQHPCSRAPLWGEAGEVLYVDLPDGLFGVPGRWSLRRNLSSTERMLWLEPRPTAATLPSFYQNYYTHAGDGASKHNPVLKWIYQHGVSLLRYMHERERLERMYLDAGNGRRVLEIGCGDGSRLNSLRRQGWQVTGQEVDEAAAENARTRFGVDVRVGDVTTIDLPAAAFDAVVMNHVIEHLLDPGAVLARCRQLLKPGGVFVVTTPNIDSYGHALFGRHWVGLDPPRHLQLFSLAALCAVVAELGFSRVEGWTTCARAQAIGRGSGDIRAGLPQWDIHKTLTREAWALLFQWRASWHYRQDHSSGEELVVRASD